jgi:hypothetical protein
MFCKINSHPTVTSAPASLKASNISVRLGSVPIAFLPSVGTLENDFGSDFGVDGLPASRVLTAPEFLLALMISVPSGRSGPSHPFRTTAAYSRLTVPPSGVC